MENAMHTVKFVGTKLIITDLRTKGILEVSDHSSGESEDMPLVEFANDLQDKLWEQSELILKLIGKSTMIITEHAPVFSGSVLLDQCKLVNTSVHNSSIHEHDLSYSPRYVIRYCDLVPSICIKHETHVTRLSGVTA